MPAKLKRKFCLKKYAQFPVREYNTAMDEELFSYPEIHGNYRLTLGSASYKGLTKLMATQLTRLMQKLNIDRLIFLGDNRQPWISKTSLERDDLKPVQEAMQYFAENKVGKRFNGGLDVDLRELPTFIKHFYCLTKYDASLPYVHFMDKGGKILGYIHYTGEIQIDLLKEKATGPFTEAVSKTKFMTGK